MGIKGLAEYFVIKYAGDADLSSDDSLGAVINGDKVRILKDKLILAYGKLEEDVTNLPLFKELNTKFNSNAHWDDFHRLMINFVNYVENNDLKKCFNYNVKLIEKLNDLRFEIAHDKSMERKEAFDLTEAIKSISLTIWEESKRIMNLHDLKGLLIRAPEAEKILNEKTIIPTWDYGPMKNPTQNNVMKMKNTQVTDLKKRLKLESLYDDAKKKLGPYASQEELDAEVKRVLKEKRNETARKSYHNTKNRG